MSQRVLLESPRQGGELSSKKNKFVEDKKDSSSLNYCSFFWKDSKLANRLNITGIITSVSDTILDLISERSTTFAEFFTNTIPYSITSLFYLVPAVVPYVPNLMDVCKRIPPKPNEIDEELAELEELLDGDAEIGEAFAHHQKLRQKILEKMAYYEKKKNHDSINLIINIIYLSLRAIQGVVILMRGTETASEEISDKAKNWIDLMLGLLNIVYMCAQLVNYYHAQKAPAMKHIQLSNNPLPNVSSASVINVSNERGIPYSKM